MPVIKINSTFKDIEILNIKILKLITNKIHEKANIPLDKILIQSDNSLLISRSGICITDKNFSFKSRKINKEDSSSYYIGVNQEEDFVYIEVHIWETVDEAIKIKMFQELSLEIIKTLNLKADNLLINLIDTFPGNWIQNGVCGIDSNFLEKSRNI